jgi:UDP-N-acetylmuramoyl-tripeptide--D-alanyl-D-alanine ligase
MALAEAAQMLDATLVGADREFLAVATDTRKLAAGDLFVALTGERFDGHEFVAEAAGKGAAGAMVARELQVGLPQLLVDDTRTALGRLAAGWRSRFDLPLVAVTGSNGKTTVKEMIAAVLAARGEVLVTEGNLNNDIGMPLTLLRLREAHRYAVIEMGMNHVGEIDYLTRLACPGIALITNAAEAHLEGLGSVDAVARAKGEIFNGLAADGVAVINADDTYAGLWRNLASPRQVVTFGIEHPADYFVEYECDANGSNLFIKTPQGGIEMRLPVLGKHNVSNAAAATAAAMQAGATLVDVKTGLEQLRAVAGRLEVKAGVNGAQVLDDTYNANPASVAAGLEVLRQSGGETMLILGDMLELGAAAEAIHRRVGALAKRIGVDRLCTVGPLARAAAQEFGGGGQAFDDHEALVAAVNPLLHGEMTVLVKGSRGSRMEQIVAAITGKPGAGNNGSRRKVG